MPAAKLKPAGAGVLRAWAWSLGVAVMGIALSAIFAAQLYMERQNQTRRDFAAMVAQFDRRLNDQIEALRLIVTLGQGLQGLGVEVSKDDWHNFVAGLDWRRMQGAIGLGFAERALAEQSAQYVSRAIALGEIDFSIKGIQGTTPPPQGQIYVWRLAEPLALHERVIGVDLAANERLKASLDLAMLSGSPSLSDPVDFKALLDIGQPGDVGILMATPVYRRGSNPASFDERRENLVGWIVAPISISTLAKNAIKDLASGLDVEIYLGAAARPDRLLYRSAQAPGGAASGSTEGKRSTTLVLAGQSLLIEHGLREAADWTKGIMPPLVILSGSVISILLGIVLWFMAAAQLRAEERARAMTRDLMLEKERADEARRIAEEWRAAAERRANEMEMSRNTLEQQAMETVQLAEELALQKAEADRAREQSEFLATHDVLTGLPNRRALMDRLQADFDRLNGSGLALLFIDLDKFKEVNDTLGHDAGDALLKKVAERLGAILRGGDYVARLGGDEFAFLLTGQVAHIKEAGAAVGRRILENLQIKMPTPGGDIQVGCTVGVAVAPYDARNAQQLVTFSDKLMYVGKKRGRNRVITSADADFES